VLSGYSPNKTEEMLGKLSEGTHPSNPELQFRVAVGGLTVT